MYLEEKDKDELAKLIVDLFDEFEKTPDAKIDDEVDNEVDADTEIDNNAKDNLTRYDRHDVRRILYKIQRYNPGIFRRFMRCGVPYYEAKRLVKRIIKLTLLYYDD